MAPRFQDSWAGQLARERDRKRRAAAQAAADDGEPKRHAPDPTCYACKGTGSVIGFGARPGNECPCVTAREEM